MGEATTRVCACGHDALDHALTHPHGARGCLACSRCSDFAPAAPTDDCMACADLGYPCHWCTVKRSEARKIAAPAARAEGEDDCVRGILAGYERIEMVEVWRCPACHFGYDAAHVDAQTGEHSCPLCALVAAESAREAAEREREEWKQRCREWLDGWDEYSGDYGVDAQAVMPIKETRAALAPAPGEAETGEVPVRVQGIVFVLLDAEGRVLMERCPKKARIHGGEWFIPGGRVEAEDRDTEATLRRELREETGLRALDFIPLRIVDGGRVGAPFLMQTYLVRQWHGEAPTHCLDHPEVPLRWVPLAEARRSPVPAVVAILAQIPDQTAPAGDDAREGA